MQQLCLQTCNGCTRASIRLVTRRIPDTQGWMNVYFSRPVLWESLFTEGLAPTGMGTCLRLMSTGKLYALDSDALGAPPPSDAQTQTSYRLLSAGVFDTACRSLVERMEVGEASEAFGELAEVRCAECFIMPFAE